MRDTISRLYPNLTPQERFQLVLEALCRGDREEIRRLAESCPQKHYSLRDAAFVDLVEASREIASTFAILWLEASRRFLLTELALSMLREGMSLWSRGFIEGVNLGWKQAGGSGTLLEEEEVQSSLDSPEQLEELHRRQAAILKGVYQGLAHFCKEMGIPPEKLLIWYPFISADVEKARSVLDRSTPAHEETARLTYELLLASGRG